MATVQVYIITSCVIDITDITHIISLQHIYIYTHEYICYWTSDTGAYLRTRIFTNSCPRELKIASELRKSNVLILFWNQESFFVSSIRNVNKLPMAIFVMLKCMLRIITTEMYSFEVME
jgi:hypothetical protein